MLCVMVVASCVLFVVCCLFAVRCSVLVACCLLRVMWLSVVRCLPSVVYPSLLSVVRCVGFAVVRCCVLCRVVAAPPVVV